MKTKNTNIVMQNKDIAGVFVVTPVILAIPLIAMRFSNEVDWKPFDFIIMGVLLSGTGFLIVLASRKIKKISHRVVIILALLASLFLIWAELAVGIFGTPFAGN